MKNIILLTLSAMLLFNCGREKAKLMTKLDSLQNELTVRENMTKTLVEVGTLIDSIDISRQLLRVNMVEGITYTDYTARMKDLNQYVKETQSKIDELEKKSKSNNQAFAIAIKKLKADLNKKNTEITLLQQKVDELGTQNADMKITIDMQEEELKDKQVAIEIKQQELTLIEARIQELMMQNKIGEADAFFARAQALEEAAKRTKLAPRKKKNTYTEALELYKKSQSLGNEKAQAKIDELTKRLN